MSEQPRWIAEVQELRALVRDTYEFWRAWDSDHHSKSSEGSVALCWPPVWTDDWDREPACEVYSYVFGPHRSHRFDTVSEAIAEFRSWADSYRQDFSTCPTEGCDGWYMQEDGWGGPVEACNRCLEGA